MTIPCTFGAVTERVPMRSYKVEVFKGKAKGRKFDMKAYTIANLRKNMISEFRSKNVYTDIYVYTPSGNYVGNMKMNPRTREIYWFSQGDINKASCVASSTGALTKGVCKKRK